MACALDWLTVVTIDGVMAMKIKHFADKIPDFVKHLKTFGEAGVVTIAGSVKSKVNMRGILCMMGGYCTDRAGDCYRMYDPINNNIYETRDVLWLNRMYFDNNGEVDALPDISADNNQPLTQVPDQQVMLRPKKKKNKKKSITFAVPNGEAGSVVSRETQFRTFGSASEDDIDFEDDNNNNSDDSNELEVIEEDDVSVMCNLLFKSCRFAPQCLRKAVSQQSTRQLFYINYFLFRYISKSVCYDLILHFLF
jgi:hypothetical protein